MKRSILVLIALTNLVLVPAPAAPLSTAFSYQGRLTDNGQLANGTYDFQFRLFDALTNGAQVPIVLGYPTVAVSNGLFTTGLDFGSNVFNGTTWWLEISLRPSGTFGEFTFLTPRQPLTPTPNALFAVNAALATTATTANGVAASVVSPAQLNTPGAPTSGQVLAFNGNGLSWTNAASAAAAWTVNGNTGTTSGANFLGTTDNQPLEFKVNGQRALRLEPNTNGAINVVGGSPYNVIDPGVIGATIGGGGAVHPRLTAYNRISSTFSVIGGGYGNSIQANTTGNLGSATIGGGSGNSVQTDSTAATIAGGSGNTNQAEFSTIGGGFYNLIQFRSSSATIGGGGVNAIRVFASFSTIGGGRGNTIDTEATASTITGGLSNLILSNAFWSSIGGGARNTIQPDAYQSIIAGGNHNTIQNSASSSTIAGGTENVIQPMAQASTIGGGSYNTIQTNAIFSTISGGMNNVVAPNSWFAVIPGGSNNAANAVFTFATGRRAKANQPGAFVWADSSDFDFASIATNEFAVRATGGVRFVSGVDSNGVAVAGVSLPAGGGSWSTLSDRNAKTHFAPVNPRELLDRLAQLPIQSWNYKSQNESVRHVGPTAQDFHAAFTVGEDDQHIATVDADGVALAAIQGLNQKLEEQLKETEVELAALKQRLAAIEKLLASRTVVTGVVR